MSYVVDICCENRNYRSFYMNMKMTARIALEMLESAVLCVLLEAKG